jgi:hypothetical protein
MPRVDGPFKVLEKINENAYKLDLPANFGVSPTFNIADLKPYLGEEDELESRMTQMQEGEDDVDINTSDTFTPTHNQISGPITRACAHQVNNQVSSFLASYSSYLDNRNMCSVLLLRNRARVRQNQDRVMDAGYEKSWNRFWVKKTMKNELLRSASPEMLGHL